MAVSHEAKKKQHVHIPSSLHNHYGGLVTHNTALKFTNIVTKLSKTISLITLIRASRLAIVYFMGLLFVTKAVTSSFAKVITVAKIDSYYLCLMKNHQSKNCSTWSCYIYSLAIKLDLSITKILFMVRLKAFSIVLIHKYTNNGVTNVGHGRT